MDNERIEYLNNIIDTCEEIIKKDGWGDLVTPASQNHKAAEEMMVAAWNEIIDIIEKKGGDE
jgi:hypothetical protein